jgi:single-strand DNA-binding protein
MYQRVVVIGNLGGDPQMRYTPDGTAVTSFNIATNRKWSDASGNPQERTTWFRVTVWRKQAEQCNQYLSKGRMVLVEGEMEPDPQTGGPRIWQDKEGRSRASYEITARTVRFLGGGGQGGAASMGGSPGGGEEGEGPIDEGAVPF